MIKQLTAGLAILTAAGAVSAQSAPQSAPAPAAPMAAPHHGMMMEDKTMTRADMLARVREHFTMMDADKNGVVTKSEMGNMRQHHMAMRGDHGPDGNHDMKMPDPNQAFDRMDTNKDGTLSRDEFAKGREVRIEKRIVMRGGPEGMDHGGDHGKMGKRHGGGMRMMAMADSNKDGNVSLAEAEAMAMQHFDKMDSNRDGKVTPEERRASRSMMMKVRRAVTPS